MRGNMQPLYSQCGAAAKAVGHNNREQANRDFLIMHPYLD